MRLILTVILIIALILFGYFIGTGDIKIDFKDFTLFKDSNQKQVVEEVNLSKESCAQNNQNICEGLSEGQEVPSCDCNTCTCLKNPDNILSAACAEESCSVSQ